jgi:hypothetical protein
MTITTLRRGSDRHDRRHLQPLPSEPATPGSALERRWSPLVIRLAVAADAGSLRRLAHMDSARPLSGQALLAEQDGSVIAALSLRDGAAIADPFVASAEAVAMLRLRAMQLRDSSAAA